MRTLRSRERKLVLGAGVLILFWIVISWITLPLWDRYRMLQEQARVAEKKTQKLQGLVRRKPVIEQQHQTYAAYWSGEGDETIQGVFLDELEQLAQASHLQMSVKPRPVQRQGTMSRFGVEIELDGTQDTLLGFIHQVLTSPQLLELARLRISTTVSKDAPLRGSLVINKIVFYK